MSGWRTVDCQVVERRRHAGEWRDDLKGTPQGAVISPILANVDLHYGLDLWFQRQWRTREAEGETMMVRYADDFVVGFQYRRDAERFLNDLKERIGRFELEMHPEKTRLIEFGRYAAENRRRRGEGGPETFDFLGFTHYCRKDRKGRYGLGRKPIAKRMARTLKRVKEELSRRMHEGIGKTGKWLGRVLNGWLNYFAVPTSLRYLRRFASHVLRLWMRAINRRSQKGGYSWEAMNRLAATYWPRLGIRHPWPDRRMLVNT